MVDAKLDICADAVQMPNEQRQKIREAFWNIAGSNDIAVTLEPMRSFAI